MTKKEMLEFVKEKYDIIIAAEVAPYKESLGNYRKEAQETVDKCLEQARQSLKEQLEKTGFFEPLLNDDVYIRFYSFNSRLKESKKVSNAEAKIKNITKKLQQERDEFCDDLIVQGLKNPDITKKIEALRARVRKLQK